MGVAENILLEILFKDSEKLWETTFNGINDYVFLLSPDGIILKANKNSFSFFDKTENEIIGKHCYEIVHKTNCHIEGCPLVRMKLSKQREKMLLPVADKWFEVTVDPILDKENNLLAAVHFISDITERKNIEESLSKSNKLLSDSQKIGKVGGWEFDMDTMEQTWTEETCRIHEVELDYQPSVEDGINFYLPESRSKIKNAVQRAIENGESFDLELELFTAKKNLRWVHAIGNVDLKKRRIYGLFQDITDQKKIELKLKESETKFRTLYNSIPIPTYTWKAVGNEFFLMQFNDEAESIHYSSIKERIGITASQLYYDSSEILYDLHLCYKEQSSFQKELIYKDKSTNEKKFLFAKYAFVSPDLVIIHIEDITERKKVEENLISSEEKYHGLFNTMQECVFVVEVINDTNGNPYDFKYLSLNKSAEVLTGYTEEKVVGRTYREIEQNINEDVIVTVGEVAQTRQPALREWYSLPTKRWLLQHLYSISSGQVVFLGIDITKRRLMEDNLKESQEKYRGLSEASFESIFISEKGICIEQNKTAEMMFGYTSEEAIGRMGTEWLISEDREMVMKNMLSEYEKPYEATALRKDGTTFPCILRGKMMHYKGKDVRITSLRDITERKKNDRLLKSTNDNLNRSESVAKLGHWEMDLDTRIFYISEGAQKIYGFDKVEIHYDEIKRLRLPEYNSIMEEAFRALIEDGKSYDIEYKIKRDNDGEIIDIHATTEYDRENHFLFGIIQDITERKSIELEIDKSNDRAREIINASNVPMALNDDDGNINFLSPSFTETFGYTQEDIPTLEYWWPLAYPDPEYREWVSGSWKMELERSKCTGEKFSPIEVNVRCKNGTFKTVLSSGVNLSFSKKNEHLVILYDISERKLAESTTERLNNLSNEILTTLNSDLDLKDLIDSILQSIKKETGFSAVGIRLKNKNDFPYFAQSGFSDDFLLTENTLIVKNKDGKVCADINENELLECTCGMVLSGINENNKSFLTKAGSFWTNNSTQLLDLSSGPEPRINPRNKCIHLGYSSMAIVPIKVNDIIIGTLQLNEKNKNAFTKEMIRDFENICLSIGNALMRIQAEKSLKDSENNLRAIFNNTNTGFILLDEQFKIVSLNKRAKDLTILALGKEPKINECFTEMLPTNRQIVFDEYLREVLSGKEIHYDVNYPQKDGSSLWFDIACKPVFSERKKIIGISYAITDLTIRKTAEKDREKLINELLDKNNNLMQFNYIVSHNLRSPVSNLIGLGNLLKLPDTSEEEKLKIFGHIQQAASNMDILIKDLNMILSTRSIIDKQNENINIPGLIEGITNTLEKELNESKCEIEFNIPDEATNFISVKSYIESIFYNLISNAIKYRSDERKPHIIISIKKDDSLFNISISDNGKGINLEKNGKYIFGLYKRFHNEVEGKGLGLHMVKTQVEALGGTISIESEVNKGTTFKIMLPCSE